MLCVAADLRDLAELCGASNVMTPSMFTFSANRQPLVLVEQNSSAASQPELASKSVTSLLTQTTCHYHVHMVDIFKLNYVLSMFYFFARLLA